MSEKFNVQYPVYVITEEDDVAFVQVKSPATGKVLNALVVFTERAEVEAWRDEHHPGWRPGGIPDEVYFLRLLEAIQSKVSMVVFDPYKMGKRVHSFEIETFMEQLRRNIEEDGE